MYKCVLLEIEDMIQQKLAIRFLMYILLDLYHFVLNCILLVIFSFKNKTQPKHTNENICSENVNGRNVKLPSITNVSKTIRSFKSGGHL